MQKYHIYKSNQDGILDKNRDLFKSGEALRFKQIGPQNSRLTLVAPYLSDSGIRLKGDIGFISISEVLSLNEANEIVEKITYSYKFNLDNHLYMCSSDNFATQSPKYNFVLRYEKDIIDKLDHPPLHLHVINELPRYKSTDLNLATFLDWIRACFFDSQSGDWLSQPHWLRT